MKYNDLSAKRTEIDFTSGGEFEGTPTAEKISSNKVGFEQADKGMDQILENKKSKPKQDASTGVANQTEVDSIIKHIMKSKEIPETQESYNRVLAWCALHCQQGTTSPKYADSRMVVEYGVNIKVVEMRAALKAVGWVSQLVNLLEVLERLL